MIPLPLRELAAIVGGTVHGDGDVTVDVVATDSRALPDGRPLFVALRSDRADGHAFTGAAVTGGAVAVLAERAPVDGGVPTVEVGDTWRALRALAGEVRRRIAPRTVAVTGSVGKTTVKDLTAAALATAAPTVASVGSFNNELGVPLTLLALEPRHEMLVAEIGARHVGDIADLAPLVAPDVSVVTAVAGVHLEVFGSIEAVATAKSELVQALRPDGVAVLNADDPRVAAMADLAPRARTYGLERPADVTARDLVLDERARPRFVAVTPWGEVEVAVPIAGRHQASNALAALTAAGELGIDLEAAAAGLAGATVSRWRAEVHEGLAGSTVLNDAYNANPTSVVAAIDTLLTLAARGRAVAVLGEMAEIGDDHDREHERVGRVVAERGVQHLVVVGDRARGLADGARAAGLDAVTVVADADEALAAATAVLREGDVVLVKASRVAGLERVAAGLTPGPEVHTP
ncbi:UDP-N-acetylmuramoyl-tripeptide--D-alanyl-D-alanine ligase [Nitriliruptoraceae bacterium ZYF776]|nr:UDP-N-acetylmuramoyl-tripeptide--D-alanyl-D-alanine ligase [Profundirhabdus halotolerans]